MANKYLDQNGLLYFWGKITNLVGTKVDKNSSITGATKTKITYDTKGLVTGGADATTADIADSTNKRYVTDTQLTVIGSISGTNTGDETVTTLGTKINAGSAKTAPVDTDYVPLVDSEASNVVKKLSWAYVKSVLKTYFDTLYTAKNGSITGATKTKITYDAKGLVTGGADATTADIADSTDKRYVTDAEKTKLSNTSGTNSGNETATTVGTLISGATEKTAPVDADMVSLMDSAASNVLKKFSWLNIKATLKIYFDTLYSAVSHNHDSAYTAKNASITAATKTKITYDTKGLVTAGADATTADIADSTNRRYVTDAQLTVIGSTSGSNTGNETTTSEGALINGATAKATPVDADMVGLMDSAASNVLKKLSWANIKATLKTYFDTVYSATGHNHSGTYQPLDADLTAIAGLAGTAGLLKKTAADTWALDTTSYIDNASKGAANGVCPLDSGYLVPSQYLPSYVDDVVELLILQTDTNTPSAPATCAVGDLYFSYAGNSVLRCVTANTWAGAVFTTPEKGKIYIDKSTNICYRYGGSVMVAVASSDAVAITNAEIDAIVA